MARKDWIRFNGVEVINLARTIALSESLGLEQVWPSPDFAAWVPAALGVTEASYSQIANAPWYDSGYPASSEFAGIIPLSLSGIDDSTLTSTPVEYITDGGHSGKPRNTTLQMVADVAIIARTERGAEFGKRWLDRTLKGTDTRMFCSGSNMHYFRYASADSPMVHRRDVRITRGGSVTRRKKDDCSVTWRVTFTLTAADPYEYGEPVEQVTTLSTEGAVGPAVTTQGSLAMVHTDCPQYDYTPITDPQHPAIVPSPTAPDFYPDGWDLEVGDTIQRYWARLEPSEPSGLNVVPFLVFTSGDTEARMVRASIWPASAAESQECDPLFSVTLTYIPHTSELTVDGEQQAVYVWDGTNPIVRRAESVAYGLDATPLPWTAFNDHGGLLLALDLLVDGSSDDQLAGDVSVSLALIPKSD